MIGKIRKVFPNSNITPIDYDPSATKVNQENRIKLMLAVARENLNERTEAKRATKARNSEVTIEVEPASLPLVQNEADHATAK